MSINLLLGDSLTDFYLDRVDLVIRYGEQKDSSMVAFTLATIDRVLCASPAYLAAFGMPETPGDLQKHNCLLFKMNNRLDDVWELTSKADQERIRIPVSGNRSANDSDIVRRWCLAGKGIACKSRLDMARDLRAGRLVVLLPDYQTPRITLSLICPGRQQITPAVLLLRDLLREKFLQLLGEWVELDFIFSAGSSLYSLFIVLWLSFNS